MVDRGVVKVTGEGELLPALAQVPGHLLWRAAGRVAVATARVLPDDVDPPAYGVLVALAGSSPASQQALADRISVSRTTMATTAADLVRAGLVERVRNPDDRRSYALSATADGVAAADRWGPHLVRLDEAVTQPLDATSVAELRGLLDVVADADLLPDTPPALREACWFLITRAQTRVHREVQAALAGQGLEPRHLGALLALRSREERPQHDLARALGITPASVVAIVDDLERRDLVRRVRSPTDRRTQVLHLEPAAPRATDAALETATVVSDRMLEVLAGPERERLLDLLGSVVTAPSPEPPSGVAGDRAGAEATGGQRAGARAWSP